MYGNRNILLLAALGLLAAVILARLTQIQIVWGRNIERDARAGAGNDRVLDTVRGSIISADGEVLARDVVSYDLGVHYRLLESDVWMETVAELTGRSEPELRRRADAVISRVERIWKVVHESTRMEHLRIVEQEQYHPLVMDIPGETAVMINSRPEAYGGLKVMERSRRCYGGEDFFPHIVGYCRRISPEAWASLLEEDRTWTPGMQVGRIGVRYRMDDTLGGSGIERTYEEVLRGRRGYVTNSVEFHPFRVKRLSETHYPEPGSDIYLSVRADFQGAVMRVFRDAARAPGSGFRSGSAVIMDVDTGRLLAAATWPSYTQEEFGSDYASVVQRPDTPLFFRPAQAALPTGSVYKLITAIAALEERISHIGTAYNCRGAKLIYNRRFRCLGHHGEIALEEAIERSCNVYFYELALALSGDQLARWGHRFGLGNPTGLDWPAEVSGSLEAPDSVFGRVNLCIGQGRFLATSLQVTRMTAAIANGGYLVTPRLVGSVRSGRDGSVFSVEPDREKISVSAGTLSAVRAGMRRAVHGPGGTARNAGLERFRAAGKTGTAELGAGRPNHAWFTGYAPYDDPKIAFALVSERTEGQGGGHAAPLMGRILEQIWPEVEAGY